MEIPDKKNKKLQIKYTILTLSILAIICIGTALWNKVFAADVTPTYNINKISSNLNTKIDTNVIWDILSQFITFVKKNIAKNNRNNKYSFNLEKDTNKLLNNNILTNSNKYIDIKNHPDREYINFLAEHNIISTQNNKFHPHNFVRLHECFKLIINSYRFKLWYDLNTTIGLTNNNYFNQYVPKYYNTAYEMWLFKWISNTENFERIILYNDLYVILKNFQNQYPNLINLNNVSKKDFQNPEKHIKRWELAKSIINIFELNKNMEINLNQTDMNNTINKKYKEKKLNIITNINDKYSFTDIENYKYKDEIEQLIRLNIIWDSNSTRFNPNQNISRSEFIVMLTKAYLKNNNLELSINNLNFDISDLDYNSNYAKYLIYAKEEWILDYLIETKQKKTYIKPNQIITRDEVYHVITDMLWIDINQNKIQINTQNNITKWEIVKIISDTLNFQENTIKENRPANSKLEELFNKIETFAEYKKLANLIL